ncbi:MAG: Nif3-like dinuclear metal center hexameric protein [Oscillospiraceae bacterium]|nr:Nif3-like dinuclear metal center hexameric protein [Oscillospiraceae bacterium]
MVTAKQIFEYLNEVMPFEMQESWDNSGLLVDAGTQTDKVMCCLDVTKAAVDKAIAENCRVIVSHHPVIFSSIKSLDCESILFKLVQNGISVISAHTNFDKYPLGTSWQLMQFCGVEGEAVQNEYAFAVKLDREESFDGFLKKVKENTKINLQYVKSNENITKVFVVAGSGKGMTEEIVAAGCDCVVTGESNYHDMLDLKELGISCICLGHDESEKISVQTFAKLISEKFAEVKTVCYIEENLVKYI